LLTLRLIMGVSRLFHVESKSFELVKNAMEVIIIECGKKHKSRVSMGFAAAFWFRDSLLEVAKLSKEQNAFRSFREGNKVYVIQKQRNDRGNFVTVTVLGDSKERGGVIIPEGRESRGWCGISEELNGLLSATAIDNHRRPLAGKSTSIGNFRKESYTFKAAVTRGKDIPKILPINSEADKILGEINAASDVILNLKVKLTCGTDGTWQATWAGLAEPSPPSGPSQGPNVGPSQAPKGGIKPCQVPGPTKVWKPVGPTPTPLISHPPIHHGSGSNKVGQVATTQLPEVSVSNRFSIFQVGESSGTGDESNADPTDPTPEPIACTEITASSAGYLQVTRVSKLTVRYFRQHLFLLFLIPLRLIAHGDPHRNGY
jgi:hypothetical protein